MLWDSSASSGWRACGSTLNCEVESLTICTRDTIIVIFTGKFIYFIILLYLFQEVYPFHLFYKLIEPLPILLLFMRIIKGDFFPVKIKML